MLGIIIAIIVGGLAGWIASMIMETDASMGALANIVVGIIGAFIGGFVVRSLLGAEVDPNGFNLWSVLTAILGALILLAIRKAFSGRRV